MKRIFNILGCAVSTVILFCACEKEVGEQNPFTGTDNRITSFSLKAGETTYVAAISGDKIIVTVPVNANLTDAEAEYELCEQATIMPNPATITDWNSEQAFRIKSYEGENRDYTYTVVRTEIPHEGNIQLLTQADVDAFAATGTTVIEGSLVVGSAAQANEETAIKNLDGLLAVKEVRYHIIINNSYAGKDLAGLKNIVRCGGLYIGNATSQVALPAEEGLAVNLPALSITGDLMLNSNSIKSISMPKLESVGALLISSNSLTALDLPVLKNVAGDLSMKSASNTANGILTEVSFKNLTSIGGSLLMQYYTGITKAEFPELSYIGNSITFELNSATFEAVNFPKLETLNGTISIERATGIQTVSIPKVKHLASFLYNKTSYGSNLPLKSLDLSSLEIIDNEFYLRNCLPLEAINLSKLVEIGGNMSFWGLSNVSKFDISNATKIAGKLYLSGLSVMTTIDISNLATLGSIEIVGCDKLATVKSPQEIGEVTINLAGNKNPVIPVFEGLETVTGMMSFTSDDYATEYNISNIKKMGSFKLTGGAQNSVLNLSDVEQIGSMDISSYKIGELNAPKLAKADKLNFYSIWSLVTIKLPLLKTVGELIIAETGAWNADNAKMTSLDAFAGITSIDKVKIEWCAKLTDFKGLATSAKGISDEANWSVTNCGYNPTLTNMHDGAYTQPAASSFIFRK